MSFPFLVPDFPVPDANVLLGLVIWVWVRCGELVWRGGLFLWGAMTQ